MDADGIEEIFMRITNKIMQRNNLSNINTNKMYKDKLSTQMATQKKINRPSDDPVVAIRSLRLRSNVTEITQYYSKNIPDAESWLKITEDALSKLSDVISNMAAQCTRGTNKPFTTTDRGTVLEQLKLLADEVYATGDADYAGRYVFTGHRTDTPLSFLSEQNREYEITEQLDKTALDSFTSVNTGNVLEVNSVNYNDPNHANISEDDITSVDVHRIRLAYNDCKAGETPEITLVTGVDAAGNITTSKFADATGPVAGDTTSAKYKIDIRNVSADPYTEVSKNPDAVIYVPETGELLFGSNRYEKLMATKDSEATSDVDEGEILINGVDIREVDRQAWQKLFGVVFQDFQLFPFGLGQNLAGSMEYDADRARAALEEAGFGARLGGMDMETAIYKDFDPSGVEISGGEAQKIAIARALYKHAPVLVLDEPTAALDPQAEYEVYKNLNHVSENRTAIFISHRMSSCRFCDRILVFDGGRLVQEGSHEELLGDENGKYYQLWRSQEQYYQ